MLPGPLAEELHALWREFEAGQSRDARFANALDRLQPLLHNYLTDGHTWRLGKVTGAQVLKRMEPVRDGLPELWPFVLSVIDDGISKGYIQDTPGGIK
jgi:putative hydrolase of HD superfamily